MCNSHAHFYSLSISKSDWRFFLNQLRNQLLNLVCTIGIFPKAGFITFCSILTGDALFIHCNILHLAPPNDSDKRRWAYICCFNRKTNNPLSNNPHAFYSKLEKVMPQLPVFNTSISFHITKARLFIYNVYRKFHLQKLKIFRKKSDIFHIF